MVTIQSILHDLGRGRILVEMVDNGRFTTSVEVAYWYHLYNDITNMRPLPRSRERLPNSCYQYLTSAEVIDGGKSLISTYLQGNMAG
jgi:hypothetical protein